jgi:hypothetical protein
MLMQYLATKVGRRVAVKLLRQFAADSAGQGTQVRDNEECFLLALILC